MGQEKEIVENAIQIIRETTELFYQQKVKEAYNKMQETIDHMVKAVDILHGYKSEHEAFGLEEERLVTSLTDAMNAMQEGDTVLLADILEYDFVEYLQELTEQMD